jgi:hypothetical protein
VLPEVVILNLDGRFPYLPRSRRWATSPPPAFPPDAGTSKHRPQLEPYCVKTNPNPHLSDHGCGTAEATGFGPSTIYKMPAADISNSGFTRRHINTLSVAAAIPRLNKL